MKKRLRRNSGGIPDLALHRIRDEEEPVRHRIDDLFVLGEEILPRERDIRLADTYVDHRVPHGLRLDTSPRNRPESPEVDIVPARVFPGTNTLLHRSSRKNQAAYRHSPVMIELWLAPPEIIVDETLALRVRDMILPSYHVRYTQEVIVDNNREVHHREDTCIRPEMRRLHDPEYREIPHRGIGKINSGLHPHRRGTFREGPVQHLLPQGDVLLDRLVPARTWFFAVL